MKRLLSSAAVLLALAALMTACGDGGSITLQQCQTNVPVTQIRLESISSGSSIVFSVAGDPTAYYLTIEQTNRDNNVLLKVGDRVSFCVVLRDNKDWFGAGPNKGDIHNFSITYSAPTTATTLGAKK